MANLKYWVWLTTREYVWPGAVRSIVDYFGSPERAFYGTERDFEQVEGLNERMLKALLDKGTARADDILGECDRLGIRLMTCQDAEYPERLNQLPDKPMLLYIQGKRFDFDEEAAIGVVGARECTAYGRSAASRIGLELARGGALVVSGMAQGVDSMALQGALKGGGRAVSVLANGLDVFYPASSRSIQEDIAVAGMLISEYSPGTTVNGRNFPVRNRIISGLSLGVLAVECKRSSGTMLTINHAQEQDRDVFAVPGSIFSELSTGTNWLIRQGAHPVTCGEDILVEYRDRFPAKLAGKRPLSPGEREERVGGMAPIPPEQPVSQESLEEKAPPKPRISREEQTKLFTDDQLTVLLALRTGSRSADELVEETQIPVRRVQTALTMLQIQGTVSEGPGRRFVCQVELAD